MPKDTPWTEYTKKLLALTDELSQSGLAECLAKKLDRPNLTQSYVAGRLNNTETLPPDDLELAHWSDYLGLRGEMRKKFFHLAQVERIPKRFRAEYADLFEAYEKTQRMVENLEKQNAELRALTDSLSLQLAEVTAQAAELIAKQEESGSHGI